MAVPDAVVARLVCEGGLRLAGIRQGADGHGHPADIGRRSRQVPADLRRALLLRDRHCRFPGCHRTRGLHAHHVWHWMLGGPTDFDNLLMLCAFHHRFVHDAGWTLKPIDPVAGRWSFHPPGQKTPHPAVWGLPGASAEAATTVLADPDPKALQPPWWHPDDYDLDSVVEIVSFYLADTRREQPPAHTAMAA